jgi:hypothetical protein
VNTVGVPAVADGVAANGFHTGLILLLPIFHFSVSLIIAP